MNRKIRLIFLPFLFIAFLFIVIYTLLDWVLFYKMEAFNIKENIYIVIIPLVLPFLAVFIWLRPRIKLLNLKRKKGNLPALYYMVASFAIGIPAMIAQQYLETATGRVVTLEGSKQINKTAKAKYYVLKKHFMDKQHIAFHNVWQTTGKNNTYLNQDMYVLVPVLDDTSNDAYLYWAGYKYHQQISNRLSDKEKDERWDAFTNKTEAEIDTTNFDQFVYLERIGNTEARDYYMKALKSINWDKKDVVIFSAVDKPISERNGNKFEWIFGALGIGAFVFLIMILIPKFEETELQKYESGAVDNKTELKEYLDFFRPKEGFYVTPIIMDINIGIFLLMVFSGLGFISFNGQDLVHWGANYKPDTIKGEWWRLLTSTFLHGGIMHLFANMIGLIFVGIFLEPVLGKKKYAGYYLLTGIIASLTSLYWHKATVSVGASGAIFGLYGIFLALLITKVFPKELNKAFLASTLVFVGYNLLMGLAGGIDNAAHIGGLVSGFIIGLLINKSIKREMEMKDSEYKV